MNLYRRIGIISLLLLCSALFLSAEELNLEQLDNILVKLETELLNSKDLLSVQELQLLNLKASLDSSEKIIEKLNLSIQSLKNNIGILENTIIQLKLEIVNSRAQTKEASLLLHKAEQSLQSYELKNKIIIGALSVISLGLTGVIIYQATKGN